MVRIARLLSVIMIGITSCRFMQADSTDSGGEEEEGRVWYTQRIKVQPGLVGEWT